MTSPLTGLPREIALAISATIRRVASAERRDATVAEMASDAAEMLERNYQIKELAA